MAIPTLYPFQADLFQRVRLRVAEGHKIVVVQGATGCGKNTWAAYTVKRAVERQKRVLFLVHRRKLVDQISARLHQFEVQHGILMRGNIPDRHCLVQVASRDTLLSRCVNHQWIGLPPADLVLVDEAHHAAGTESEYRRILGQYSGATVLLLSATPVGPDGAGLGPWATALECAAPTSQLVAGGFLVPVRCYAPDRKRRGNKYVKGLAGDLVASWKAYGENRPTVLFCGRVQHSRDAVEAFRASGVTAEHVDADTDDYTRDRIYDDLGGGRVAVVSNVGIVGEGVDIPALACCQLFCECGSRVRFLQACGRIMRPFAGKEYGILIDHSGAVFQHGFPDEDTPWTLEGNVNALFEQKHKAGETAKALYCKRCQMVFHGVVCPNCGRAPVKPPASIFAPPPLEVRNEILTEAERVKIDHEHSRERKIQTWWACLATANKRGGTFTQAAAMYHRKYKDWPPNDFPMLPGWDQRKKKISEVYPEFGKKKVAQ